MSSLESLNIKSEVTTINGLRYYIIDGKPYPSVTTILGEMLDQSWLEEWADRIGKENADRISTLGANRGSVMHNLNEYFLTSKKSTKKERLLEAQQKIIPYIAENNFTEKEERIGRKLFYNFYLSGAFDNLKSIKHAEEVLYCTLCGGYAGRMDLMPIDLNDNIFVLDFKSSKKPKNKKKIGGYYLQVAAYFLAYYQLTGIKPAYCEVWISNELDDEPQIFHLSIDNIKQLIKRFLKLVKEFHKQHPIP